jgi:hypothetical protein
MVALNYRTDDPAQWGSGLGRDLEADEIDQNFYDLETRLEAVETNPALPAEIASISVEGNQLTITMSDSTVFGPYSLPQAAFRFTGAFQATHDYKKYDFLTANSGLYMVLHNFTSGTSFVFGSDAEGPFYQLIMPFPDFYDIGFFFPGKPGTGIIAGQTMLAFRTTARTPFYLPTDLPDSSGGLSVAPAAALSFPIYQDATAIGALDFALGSTTGTFTFAADVAFSDGDVLRVLAPTGIDANATDLTIVFAAVKGAP